MFKIDVHSTSGPSRSCRRSPTRSELPFVRREHGLTVLFLAGERPYVIDLAARRPPVAPRWSSGTASTEPCCACRARWGSSRCRASRRFPLIDAYHDGALSLGGPFGVWGAVALDRADPDDVDRALTRGCVGLSLPAGALAASEALSRAAPAARAPGAARRSAARPPRTRARRAARRAGGEASLGDPLWWPALTRYVAEMQAAWLAFLTAGRAQHPELRVVFSMLAGLAPLHAERLSSRGGPEPRAARPAGLLRDLLLRARGRAHARASSSAASSCSTARTGRSSSRASSACPTARLGSDRRRHAPRARTRPAAGAR